MLGFGEDAERYETVAERVSDWIFAEYFTPNGRCAVNTMTAYVLCLAFGFGNQAWAKAQLLKMLKEEGGLVTGFVGTYCVAWECVDDTHLHVGITVPFGASAEVELPFAPDSAYEVLGGRVLGAGSHEVTYETTEPLRRVPCAP